MGQRSRSPGQIFRRGIATFCVALVFIISENNITLIYEVCIAEQDIYVTDEVTCLEDLAN